MSNTAIIVGAGVTGLTAATQLVDAGWHVTLLEGNDRIGGRTFTRKNGSALEEQGAEFFHPDHHPRLATLMAKLHLASLPVEDSTTFWVDGPQERAGNPSKPSIQTLCAEIDQDVSLIDPDRWISEMNRHLDLPFAHYLERYSAHPSVIAEFLAWTGTLTGADPREYSALGLLRDFKMFGSTLQALTARESRIAGGTGQLAQSLAAALPHPIEFNAKVSSVKSTADGFEVRIGAGRQLSSSAVIITTPFNTLHRLRFPGQTETLTTASRLGHANRSHKYWFNPEMPFAPRIANRPTSLCYLEASETAGCIIASEDIPAQSAAAGLALPETPLAHARGHFWQKDPMAGGAWMTLRPGQAAILDELQQLNQQQPRCLIAGADVSPIWPGWIEGALHAGSAAASKLLAT